ncbi:hypothetical protein LHS21_004559 [Salmonella enterica subsp. enterica serovar Newport]|nr:hypothetical protein [Salmonella enterica]EII7450277.1 hypothetical protein [Salmonella enterica subsp. enterica serovar Newport]
MVSAVAGGNPYTAQKRMNVPVSGGVENVGYVRAVHRPQRMVSITTGFHPSSEVSKGSHHRPPLPDGRWQYGQGFAPQ